MKKTEKIKQNCNETNCVWLKKSPLVNGLHVYARMKRDEINDQTTWPLWHTRNYAVARKTRWNRFHSFELKNRGNQIIRHFLDWRTQKFKQNQNFDNFFKNFDTISTMSSNHFCFKYLHNAFAIGSRNWNAHCKKCHCACFSGEQINFS